MSYPSDYFNKHLTKPLVIAYAPTIGTKNHYDVSKAVRTGPTGGVGLAVECVINFLHVKLKNIKAKLQGDWKSNGILIAFDKDVITPLDLLAVKAGYSFVLEGDTGTQLTTAEKEECMWALTVANRIALIRTNPSSDYCSMVVSRIEEYLKCPPWNISTRFSYPLSQGHGDLQNLTLLFQCNTHTHTHTYVTQCIVGGAVDTHTHLTVFSMPNFV